MSDINTLKSTVLLSDIIRQTLYLKQEKPQEYLGKCPFHADNTPSFRVYDETGKYYCYGCQAQGDVLDWLQHQRGMDLNESRAFLGDFSIPVETNATVKQSLTIQPIMPVPKEAFPYQFKNTSHSKVYIYRNQLKQTLFLIARYEATATEKKWFCPAVYTKDGWINKAPVDNRPLYGLDSLENQGLGMLFEGEKCVDAFREMFPNTAALTWMGGSMVIQKTDLTPLSGRRWIYWQDNDEGGKKTAAHLAKIIPDLYVLPIPEGKEKGWDVADAIQHDNWTRDDIVAILKQKVLYSDLKPIAEEKKEEKSTLPGIPHGLCGEITEWINATAYKKQPLLAINAALAFVGALKGQRVCTERKLLTNIYALSLGESGCGKDHPKQCIEALAQSVYLHDQLLSGPPASGTGLIKRIKKTGRCLVQIDELGRVIGNINSKNAGGFQREILDNFIMLYSSASTLFREKEYASGRDDKEKNAIIKPCLCIHAMTVPEKFYNNLTSDDVIDGFLSRWMIVASDNPDPEESEVDVDIDDVPKTITSKILDIHHMTTDVKTNLPANNEHDIERIQNAVNPKVIRLTPEAKEILSQYKELARQKKNYLRAAGSPLDALWVRLGENAHKVALILQDGDYITDKDVQWACDWVMYWTQYSIDQVKDRLSENEYDKRMKHVLAVIRKNPGITKSALINHTRYGKSAREDILDSLEESGMIRHELADGPTKKVKTYFLAQ